MYEVRKPAQLLDLAYVLLNLWQRGRDEIEGIGLTPEQAFVQCGQWMFTNPSGALLVAGTPVFVTGIVLGTPSFTWFQATDAFTEHASQITRFLRRELRQIPGEVVIYSQCMHPESARWFQVLGFDRDDWQSVTVTGRPLYRFRRHAHSIRAGRTDTGTMAEDRDDYCEDGTQTETAGRLGGSAA